ncbi:hypothetical protein DFH08DRAFT_814667 [Mycena albidolilacea]|uniref:Uncharacterized protein n=1 Tax=Mycena albidolilacea TaxID=1033008 RepID=A0AAD6ZNU7_9AGAR|nr:hypothetical protein DFH08DRAFT_814667 [Mycena albidolilacea]
MSNSTRQIKRMCGCADQVAVFRMKVDNATSWATYNDINSMPYGSLSEGCSLLVMPFSSIGDGTNMRPPIPASWNIVLFLCLLCAYLADNSEFPLILVPLDSNREDNRSYYAPSEHEASAQFNSIPSQLGCKGTRSASETPLQLESQRAAARIRGLQLLGQSSYFQVHISLTTQSPNVRNYTTKSLFWPFPNDTLGSPGPAVSSPITINDDPENVRRALAEYER